MSAFSLLPKGIPFVKRLADLALAALALVVLSPILFIIMFLILIDMGLPILYRQKRPGYLGKIFTLYKFRTMKDTVDESGLLLTDADRLTPLGRFLRATSLDELPELVNVLKGEMSLVGPRPLLIEYLPLYNQEQQRRHSVLPGITGWAQVNGRNTLTWPEKFSLDVWYVDHWSIWLDVKILLLTVVKVLRREGISEPGQATAEPFRGNSQERRDQPSS